MGKHLKNRYYKQILAVLFIVSLVPVMFLSYFMYSFVNQFHQKSYIKICSSIWIELFYIIVRCNRSCTGNVFTMISQHVRVKTSTRTCRPLRTNVS